MVICIDEIAKEFQARVPTVAEQEPLRGLSPFEREGDNDPDDDPPNAAFLIAA
jgi:hypothetical protein